MELVAITKMRMLKPEEAARRAREKVAEFSRERAKAAASGKVYPPVEPEKAKPPINKIELNRMLLENADRGNAAEVERLLKAGADVDARNDTEGTALMMACAEKHKEVVVLLLANGADVNAKDNNMWTALIGAAWLGHGEIVGLLVGAGADINARENEGWTALMRASNGGYTEVVEVLAGAGADMTARDHNGRTALMWAAWKKHKKVVKILKKHGAKE